MGTPAKRTERIELRAQPALAHRLRQAASLEGKSLSAFMLEAASASAEEVLTTSSTTVVPTDFFDELWSALDRRPKPNRALTRRAAAPRKVTQR